jgi:hypothetical protein
VGLPNESNILQDKTYQHKVVVANGGNSMVEHLTHNPKIGGEKKSFCHEGKQRGQIK